MTFNTTLIDAEPNQLILEISPTAQNQAWQQSQSFSTPAARYRAYLNALCLSAVLTWLKEEYSPKAQAQSNPWEVVNGTAIIIDQTRFVIIPSETIDLSEIQVPQEWVDIPGWAADYYLAVQVEPDEGWVKIWGYATHQQIKSHGEYNHCDRTYTLDEDNLIGDISILWVAQQLCLEEPTRSSLLPLPTLPLAQAENLLHRLGNPKVLTPRLEVPFQLWGALLEHGGWRKKLYDLRQGRQEQWSVLQWLSQGVTDAAQQFGWGKVEFQPSLVGARGNQQTPTPGILTRQLVIAGQSYELQIIPQGSPESRSWRFQLQNAREGDCIPGGFKLRLLTEDLQPFDNNEDIATTAVEQLFVEVALEPGEGLVWEIEPIPENYEQEILHF